MPAPLDPWIGQLVADRFLIRQRIGDGGMGTVYLAEQAPVGRPVAVKILLPEWVSDPRKLRRFMNEARILGGLHHPHTVRLVDFGHLPGGQLFIAMEYVPGGTLADALAAGRLPEALALRVARQILGALVEAHAHGIVHRDLKPTNVLFDVVAGEQAMVRVADFGIARFNPLDVDPSASTPPGPVPPERSGFGLAAVETLPGVRLGSPAYVSPEQAFARAIDGRSDLYSLGVMLYEMLAGHRPFDAADAQGLYLAHVHAHAPPLTALPELTLDPATVTLVERLMAKAPEDRPATAAVALQAVEAVLARIAPAEAAPALAAMPAAARPPEDTRDFVVGRGGPPGWVWGVAVGGLLVLAALWLVR